MNLKKENKQNSGQRVTQFPKGKKNSLTDVPGVKAGHLTVHKDFQNKLGKKVSVRTGFTAVLPYAMEKEMRLFAGCFILNGKGEMTGYEVMEDFCYLNSPIVVTNSFNVGKVYDAILSYGFALKRDEIWPPLVVGVDDSYLNDMNQFLFKEEEILEAFRKASDGQLAEGSVGIGLGLSAFGWKGGIGSASRLLAHGGKKFSLGILVVSNHGHRSSDEGGGSLTIVVGVDIPVLPQQIQRIVRSLVSNLSLGAKPNSRDTVSCILFSTANPMNMENQGPQVFDFQMIDDSFLDQIIGAGLEAIEEAILNSLLKATPIRGKLGRIVRAISKDEFEKFVKEGRWNDEK
jgi:D-aminopeptidase